MKRVVIVGGGFAGAYCAKNLQRDFDVTLIDSEDYFEYTPSILRTIVEPAHMKKIHILHKKYLKKGKFIMGRVDKITAKEVFLGKKKIKFDYLVIATGSSYPSPIKEQDVVLSIQGKTLRKYHEKLEKAKRILIAGGGIVGVELAAEIAEHYKDKEVTLVHSRGRVMHRNKSKVSKYGERFLKKRGVKLVFHRKILEKKGKSYITDKGEKIQADMAFFATGIKPNSKIMKNSFPKKLDERSDVVVNSFLQVSGFKNIFSAGDVTSVKEEKLAQNAEEHAVVIVKNIRNVENKKKLESYTPKERIMVISLGKYDGIVKYKNFALTGIIPAFLKWFVELKTMIRYR